MPSCGQTNAFVVCYFISYTGAGQRKKQKYIGRRTMSFHSITAVQVIAASLGNCWTSYSLV